MSTASFSRISAAKALEILSTQSSPVPRLFDVRDPATFAAAHHPAAVPLNAQGVPAAIAELPRETPVLICCYHGISSQSYAAAFAQNGFPNAYSIDGGWDALEDALEVIA
jgi:thiosulfate sulfurtransferase